MAAGLSRFQALGTRGLARFVGREAELERLCQTLASARTGHGQVVAVVGEPGIGKSRLVYEFTQSHQLYGGLVLTSDSAVDAYATPYLPVITLFKRFFGIGDRDDPRESGQKVITELLRLDRAFESLVPAFLAFFDLPVDDRDWRALDASRRRRRTLDALTQLVVRASEAQPLVLVFEDLEWMDSASEALLKRVVERLGSARVVLVVTHRPDYEQDWPPKHLGPQVRLDRLSAKSADELLGVLVGNDTALRPLKRRVIERADGHALCLEELVRTLVDSAILVGERGHYRLAQPLESVQVPGSVQEALATRIERLSPIERRILQAASAIGRDVPVVLLEAVADVAEPVLSDGLTRLQSAEFLYETQARPDREYTFRHALTHEAAYSTLLDEARRALHARVAQAIRHLYADRLTEHIERLACHALRGELREEAVRSLRQAGAKASARAAHREAAACFEQALGVLRRLPENREILELAVDLHFDLRGELFALAEFQRLDACLREAERLAEALSHGPRLGRVLAQQASLFNLMGKPDRAIASAQRAVTVAVTAGDTGVEVAARTYLAVARLLQGDHRAAIALHRQTIEQLREGLVYERFGMAGLPAVFARGYAAQSLAELGQFADGLGFGEDAVRIAGAVKHPYTQVVAAFGLGFLWSRKGDLERACGTLEHGLVLCEANDIRIYFPLLAQVLGSCYALSERLSRGVALLEQAESAATSLGLKAFRSTVAGSLGEAYLLVGRTDHAFEFASRALDLAEEHGERGYKAWTLRLLGDIASRRQRLEAEPAGSHYREAMVLAEKLGMRPLIAHCHCGLGKLYRRSGDRPEAEAHLATAATLYREMDMRFWLARLGRELAGSSR